MEEAGSWGLLFLFIMLVVGVLILSSSIFSGKFIMGILGGIFIIFSLIGLSFDFWS